MKRTLTEQEITRWIRDFHRQEGYYPGMHERKMVPGQPTERWPNLNVALLKGGRGLPGGNSLARIRNKLVGLDGAVHIHVIADKTVEVEPERTLPLVPDSLLRFLPELPLMERSILTRYLEGERQVSIAAIYGMSQAGISYRIARAIHCLKYIEKTAVMAPKAFEKALRKIGVVERDVQILVTLRRRTGQSHTAAELGVTQGLVRHTLYKTLRDFGYTMLMDPEYRPLLQQLELLRDNPAILVVRPPNHHSGRHADQA